MINKIELYGLAERAEELKAAGKRDSEIARILTEESGKRIIQMNVCRYWQSHHKAMQEVVSKREDLQAAAAKTHLDSIAQLSFINEETLTILKGAKQAQDFRIALKSIERVEKQLELQAKLLGEISEQPTQVVINVMQVAQSQPQEQR